ncbi:putative phytosulfokines 6 [Juglans microcarpa x Juglans regia]|uniref:putative phytosulfokines 6 n=1 Tax=Juglans microcarpa x Juglans regia TaxID=2249226 RepID=UPI001B7E139B|nr:putative phytosulfokines 6 [Juglans microcarpa x Juglans regia]
MKPQNFPSNVIFIFFVFLLCSYLTSARLLATEEGENGVKVDGNITPAAGSFTDLEDLSNLMGLEESCDDKDEECLNRRMIAEAHLDYIYTQKHKP